MGCYFEKTAISRPGEAGQEQVRTSGALSYETKEFHVSSAVSNSVSRELRGLCSRSAPPATIARPTPATIARPTPPATSSTWHVDLMFIHTRMEERRDFVRREKWKKDGRDPKKKKRNKGRNCSLNWARESRCPTTRGTSARRAAQATLRLRRGTQATLRSTTLRAATHRSTCRRPYARQPTARAREQAVQP